MSDTNVELTEQQRRLGVVTLHLLVNQDWVHRRVEKAVYCDPVTIRRTKSIDFTLPTDFESPLGCVDGGRLDYVPLALMTKWRVANVDIRDDEGCALPLIDRQVYTPIVVAMLVALAHLTRGQPIPTSPDENRLPRVLEHELTKLVVYREELALSACEELPVARDGEDEVVGEWRRDLSTSYVFMSLAWTFARGFPLMVPLYGSAGRRRVIKFGYDAYRYRPRTQWRSVDRLGRIARDAIAAAIEKSPLGSPDTDREADVGAGTGRLLLRIVWLAGGSSSLPEPAATPKVTFSLAGPDGATRSVEVLGTEQLVEGLLPGEWYIVDQPNVTGYSPADLSPKIATITADATSEICLPYREKPKRIVSSKPPMDFGRDSLLWWLLEEIGMTSRRVMFGLRLERSGSYHFEVEAPAGFVVTRVKLSRAGSKGRVSDMSARSSSRASVYARGSGIPTRALVLANVRPRSDTMVDLSWVTALVTAGVLITYATWHLITGNAPSDATIVLLAAPGALAAFAAQPPSEVIVSRMTAGLRYFSLLPGLVAFAVAAATMAWPKSVTGKVLDCSLAVVAGGIALLWTFTHWWTRRPTERRWTQGPPRWEGDEDEARVPLELRLTEISQTIEDKCGEDVLWTAYEVRDRLRADTQPLAEDLEDEYLIQEYLGRRVRRPPSVFVDSGEVAPTFMGLWKLQREALERAVGRSVDVDDDDDVQTTIGV